MQIEYAVTSAEGLNTRVICLHEHQHISRLVIPLQLQAYCRESKAAERALDVLLQLADALD